MKKCELNLKQFNNNKKKLYISFLPLLYMFSPYLCTFLCIYHYYKNVKIYEQNRSSLLRKIIWLFLNYGEVISMFKLSHSNGIYIYNERDGQTGETVGSQKNHM